MIHVYFTIMLFFLYKKYISQSTKKKKISKKWHSKKWLISMFKQNIFIKEDSQILCDNFLYQKKNICIFYNQCFQYFLIMFHYKNQII